MSTKIKTIEKQNEVYKQLLMILKKQTNGMPKNNIGTGGESDSFGIGNELNLGSFESCSFKNDDVNKKSGRFIPTSTSTETLSSHDQPSSDTIVSLN
jgi:hypothetical protein